MHFEVVFIQIIFLQHLADAAERTSQALNIPDQGVSRLGCHGTELPLGSFSILTSSDEQIRDDTRPPRVEVQAAC